MSLLRLSGIRLIRGGRLLFDGLDLVIGAGDAVQATGQNGAGKSSLLRLVAGLLQPNAGSIERCALALADDKPALDRELPLARALHFWTGRDPTLALEAMGIAPLAGVPVRFLSSGQTKRASIARVIASGTPLWLLDEPLNALDDAGAKLLGKAIDHHRTKGGAVLAASHFALPGNWSRIEVGG